MSRSRMFGDDDPQQAKNVSPRRTIVGGRPPENRTELPPVPVGLQRLLRLASVDPEFCEALVERRAEMAEAAGVSLTPSEAGMLKAISDEQLRDMAAHLPPPTVDRRGFLRQAARAAVLLLGGAALTDCAKKGASKSTDETPPRRTPTREMQGEGGADPGLPPPRPREDGSELDAGTDPADPVRGARPDRPPARPKDRRTATTGGAAPDHPPQTPIGGVVSDVPPRKPRNKPRKKPR